MARKNPGGHDPEGVVTQIDAKIAQLKEATREANEATKGVHEAIREGKAILKGIEEAAQIAIDTRVAEAVAIGLESFKEALDGAIESGTERTYKRFDELAELLLGEDKGTRRKGLASLPEIIEAKTGRKP